MSNTAIVCYVLSMCENMNLRCVELMLCLLNHECCYKLSWWTWWICSLWKCYALKHDMICIASMTWYGFQVWHDMDFKYDTIWISSMIWYVARNPCTRYDDAWCIGLKKGCQLTILGIAPITELTDGLLKRVSIPNLWLLNMLDRRSYETGQYPWTHAKDPT